MGGQRKDGGSGGFGGQQGVQPKWFQNNSQFQNMMGNTQGYGGGYGSGYQGNYGTQPNHFRDRYNRGGQQQGFDNRFQNYNQQYNYPQQQMGWLNQQLGGQSQPMAKQIGTAAPVANTGNSFVQGSLGSKKGDANYDAFSDFNNDGTVSTLDFGQYQSAQKKLGGSGSMVESQQSKDNNMKQMESLRGLMNQLQTQMGGSNQGIGGYGGGYNQGIGGYGGYYKDGGLIRGYQDGGAMGGEIIDESMSMMPGPMGGEMVDESMTMMSDPMAPSPGMGGGNDAMLTIVLEAKSALEGTHPDPMSAIQTFVEVFGEDEFMSLKEHVLQSIETGEDKFASDGMSDSIPGNIDGMEEVALSEGEYVVPADVVSGMGNGDTDSGAQRMREMIEMVRSARTGGVEQPPAVDPSMYSPV